MDINKKVMRFTTLAFLMCACVTNTFAQDTKVVVPANSNASNAQSNAQPTNNLDSDDVDINDAPTPPPINVSDPLEHFNRSAFIFNNKMDTYFLKPIATAYNKILPSFVNQGIHNFFNNILTLPTIANDILQMNIFQAYSDIWRLALNTVVGMGGFVDVATKVNIPIYYNDFGLTLTNWGYKNSSYFVIPFWGPSTIRDGLSMPVDYYAFSIYPHIHPVRNQYALYGLGVVDRRANLLQYQDVFDEAAIDQYIFVRNAYLQHRAFEIEQNKQLSFINKKALKSG